MKRDCARMRAFASHEFSIGTPRPLRFLFRWQVSWLAGLCLPAPSRLTPVVFRKQAIRLQLRGQPRIGSLMGCSYRIPFSAAACLPGSSTIAVRLACFGDHDKRCFRRIDFSAGSKQREQVRSRRFIELTGPTISWKTLSSLIQRNFQ